MADLPAGELSMGGLRVLVVEDEFLIALDIDRILQNAGAKQILTANHVADALRILSDGNALDVAVLDLKLDKENALPVAERLHALAIPFVFLTGAPDATQSRGFPQAPVVAKPFNSATLLAALSMALSRC